MKIIIKIFLTILITIQFSCGAGNQAKERENESATSPAPVAGKAEEMPFANIQFASKYDTSCGMPLAAGIEDTLHLNDKIYGFCSKECKEEFANKLKAEKKR
jgi:YHS domain-containing protein